MKISISMKTRDGLAFADGYYSKEETIVKAGGKVSKTFNASVKALSYREDPRLVDEQGSILQDCKFNSPSLAAQFVNGNYSNGYRVWKVNGKNLGKYLEEQGLK